MTHENTGTCEKCREILNARGGTSPNLRNWFSAMQMRYPDFHVSCAVRGRIDQEAAVQRKASRAHFGQSAHNYSPALAIDTFFLIEGKAQWPIQKYREICGKKGEMLPGSIEWYGAEGSPFYELPHFEISHWVEYVKNNQSRLTTED